MGRVLITVSLTIWLVCKKKKKGSTDATYPSGGDPYANISHLPNPSKEKTLQEEQTDPLDFSCGGGSSSEQLIQQGFEHAVSTSPAGKAIVHPYAFGRAALHPDYTSAERSFYYRDNLGMNALSS